MSELFKLFIVFVYIFLVYKYHKNINLLLLFTLATILILCNINKVSDTILKKEGFVESPADAKFESVNSFDSKPVKSKSTSEQPVSKSNDETVNMLYNNNILIPQAAFSKYQMGPFDNLVLKTGNPKSEYLKLNNAPLASSADICVYQGNENPLKCKKTTGLNMGPSIDGEQGSPKSMFMFMNNKSSPDCCPSTFSTSTGCVCTTENQRKYINSRGMVNGPVSGVGNETGSPL